MSGADGAIAGKACALANVIAPFGHACRAVFAGAQTVSEGRRRFVLNPLEWFLGFVRLSERRDLTPQEIVARTMRSLAFLIEVAPKDERAELQAASRRLVKEEASIVREYAEHLMAGGMPDSPRSSRVGQ